MRAGLFLEKGSLTKVILRAFKSHGNEFWESDETDTFSLHKNVQYFIYHVRRFTEALEPICRCWSMNLGKISPNIKVIVKDVNTI